MFVRLRYIVTTTVVIEGKPGSRKLEVAGLEGSIEGMRRRPPPKNRSRNDLLEKRVRCNTNTFVFYLRRLSIPVRKKKSRTCMKRDAASNMEGQDEYFTSHLLRAV